MLTHFCGLKVEVDRPIPGLEPLVARDPAEGPDLTVFLDAGHPWNPGDEAECESKYLRWDEKGDPLLEVSRSSEGHYFRLSYSDGTDFTIDGEGSSIWATWSEPYTLEWMSTYLLGPVMGFALRRRGLVSLHAGAVVHEGDAVAVAGPPGVGKSTTTTAFARRGFSVLTDDMLPLVEEGGRFLAQPTYPRMRLWDDSVERFYGRAEALPLLTPRWEKRALDLRPQGLVFESHRKPLAAIYVLQPTPGETQTRIEVLRGRQALMALVNNTYINYLLDAEMRASEFDLIGRLISQVPLRALVLSDPRPSPETICDLVLTDHLEIRRQRSEH